MLKIDEFEKHLKINERELDKEIVQQPSLFYEVGKIYSAAVSERDYLKDELAKIDAELSGALRKSIEKNGERATDARVASAVLLDKSHVTVANKLIDAKEELEKIAALRDAFQMRAYMLRDLCSLFVANYFSQDSVKANEDQKDVVYRRQRAKMNDERKRVSE